MFSRWLMGPHNDLDGLLGELIAQQLPPGPAIAVRSMGVRVIGANVRRAIETQGWAVEHGGKARVDAEWLASVLKSVDDGHTEVGHNPDLSGRAWAKVAKAVESKNRGKG